MPNDRRMTQRDLRRVARAAREADQSKERLRAAILQARESGETLRDIGEAAGLSHSRVLQIVREGEKEADDG